MNPIIAWGIVIYAAIALGTADWLMDRLKKEGTKINRKAKVSVAVAGFFWILTFTVYIISTLASKFEKNKE